MNQRERRSLIEEIVKIKVDAHFIKPEDAKGESSRLKKLPAESLPIIKDEILRMIKAICDQVVDQLQAIDAELPTIEAEIRKAFEKKQSERQEIYRRG